jgi:hypothetical protein
MLTATLTPPATAAQRNIRQFNAVRSGGQMNQGGHGHAGTTKGPKQKRWVCGPIVNYDGTKHCHWVP